MTKTSEKVIRKKRFSFFERVRYIFLLTAVFSIFNILSFMNLTYAQTIDLANVYYAGDCGSLLTYKGVPVTISYVQYSNDGVNYPAYCLDKTKVGVETISYQVSVQSMIQDVGLWRRIINGYPYKSIQELGVANKEEAFSATKQAIYCYIHGNNPDDYGPIGEAGERTLQAMRNIINNAQNSGETKLSSTITINKNISEWKQDEIDKNYLSKMYNVSAKSNISNYKIILNRDGSNDLGGIKLTDENNNEKSEFTPNEKFKILVPIKNMTEKGVIQIEAKAQVETKPILYGSAPSGEYQDYALTAATYEDGSGNIKDEYQKNETKIIVIKKDQENNILLKDVEFELLNEDKEVVYSDLKTNEEGKIIIENLLPGTYYLKETKSVDGYELYTQPIKIEIELNQEMTVTVNNKKEEKPIIDTKIKTSKEVKKLPVTGM